MTSRQKHYAAALSAWNSGLGVRGHYGVSVATMWAPDKEDAYKLAVDSAITAFPCEKGWTQHCAVVMPIKIDEESPIPLAKWEKGHGPAVLPQKERQKHGR